jgi:hypothetical protein
MTESAEGEDDQITPEQQQLVALVSQVVSHVANEPLLLARYEHKQADKFERLWPKDDEKAISERLDKVALHMGGPPRLYILRHGENPPPEDGFPGAALQEALSVFQRARTSVIRAHMFHVGNRYVEETPNLMTDDPEIAEGLLKMSQEAFWEYAAEPPCS